MSNSKYTPGPWVFDAGSMSVETCDGGLVALPRSGGDLIKDFTTTQMANARLIASAPEMLEALEKVIRQLPEELTLDGEIFRDELKSLIKKAKGEK